MKQRKEGLHYVIDTVLGILFFFKAIKETGGIEQQMRHTERRIRPLILDILFCKGEQVHVCGHRDQLPLAPGGGGGGTTRPPLPHLHSTCTLLTPGTSP